MGLYSFVEVEMKSRTKDFCYVIFMIQQKAMNTKKIKFTAIDFVKTSFWFFFSEDFLSAPLREGFSSSFCLFFGF